MPRVARELVRSKSGIAGICILFALVLISVYALVLVPAETLRGWNDPDEWLDYPKTAHPQWVNWFLSEKIPEHLILDAPAAGSAEGPISASVLEFSTYYDYADFPDGFIFEYEAHYTGAPVLRASVLRPDGVILDLYSESLPYSDTPATYQARVFATDESIRKRLDLQSGFYRFDAAGIAPAGMIFSNGVENSVLDGRYVFALGLYGTHAVELADSRLIIGGRAFGIMGTDELRRDLAIGLVWGTPLALFIGVTVAIGSVASGLLYGVYAGYKGRYTDETMMRLNDIVYALPALPFLIILAITLSSSIFVVIGFLMIFGWVGVAKVARSMALQARERGYVEAAQMMGQRDLRVIFRHVLPQLLPYALASVALSVPAAITTEAGLSFLGLGDPEYPTWGQILHDANGNGAAARGFWWWIIPPGIMIAITGLAFVFIGNALDKIADPRQRS